MRQLEHLRLQGKRERADAPYNTEENLSPIIPVHSIRVHIVLSPYDFTPVQ